MFNFADLFAFMYATDLEALDLIVEEAVRILAERKRDAGEEEPLAKIPAGILTERS
jgi:hypothetical protein